MKQIFDSRNIFNACLTRSSAGQAQPAAGQTQAAVAGQPQAAPGQTLPGGTAPTPSPHHSLARKRGAEKGQRTEGHF